MLRKINFGRNLFLTLETISVKIPYGFLAENRYV